MKIKKIITIIAIILVIALIGWLCYGYYEKFAKEVQNPIATMEIEGYGTIPDFMIQGGDKEGNGSGSPTLSDIKDDVAVDKEYSIKGEFVANGYNKNTIRHEEGVISMARGDYSAYGYVEEGYNSAGSQFFIMTKNTSTLNGLYAAFGKVIEGMDVIHNIENVEVVTRNSSEADADKPVNQLFNQ